MIRLVLAIIFWFAWHMSSAQNINDNCENAMDITNEVFHYLEFPESCNSIIGTLHPQNGLVADSIGNVSVDDPVYTSHGCIGYRSETTDHYKDLWYKTTFNEGDFLFAQSVFLFAGDTIEMAIYYGHCGALFQSQCFTLTHSDST